MLDMLSLPEVAELLQVHNNTVYDLLKAGDLPGVKVGRDWRIRAELLAKFLRDHGAVRVITGDRMLTTDDVGAELRATRDTVREMCSDGRLPAAKIGQLWRISPLDLQAFANGEVVATAPVGTGGAVGAAGAPVDRLPRGGGASGGGGVERKVG